MGHRLPRWCATHAVSALGAARQRYLLSALDRLPEPSRVFGITARLMTGSGTFMLTIVYLCMAGAHDSSADCSLATADFSGCRCAQTCRRMGADWQLQVGVLASTADGPAHDGRQVAQVSASGVNANVRVRC